jgi:sporulation protein YlmC with PRC-barrel domain
MKKSALMAIALGLGLAVSANGALADDKPRVTKDRAAAFTLDRAHMDSKHLVGMSVKTAGGDRLGEIDHMVVDTKTGKVSHVIVGVGGVAGVGERHVVVPWSRVQFRQEGTKDKDMVAIIDRATLDAAPRYTRTDRERVGGASPATAPAGDRDRDGVRNRDDRAPSNPSKQ